MSYIIARTAVEKTLYSYDKLFDYIVPQFLENQVFEGSRVIVPFGYGNKKRQALVVELFEEDEPSDKLKEIASAPDKYPLLTKEMISLSEEISKRCYCTRFDAIKAMLPIGINYKISSVYSISTGEKSDININNLTAEQLRILNFIPKGKKSISQDNLLKKIGSDCETKELCELISMGLVDKTEKVIRKVGDASETMIKIVSEDNTQSLTPRQTEVFEFLCHSGEMSEKELRYFTGAGQTVIDALIKKGVCETFIKEIYRTPESIASVENTQITLTQEQTSAYNTLLDLLDRKKPAVSLLYGVTGSGKTSVFMKLMETALTRDGGIIVMVPEIALTPQVVNQFKARFGHQVAIFHSGLSMGERLDEWKRVRMGKAKIAVGTRSAVFAPFEKISLIIMDEEQEYTYKSEKTPRFHARDVAKIRCVKNNALLVLASATPSVESYFMAKNGVYKLCVLKNRYGEAKLPEVVVADMNEESARGNRTGFSRELKNALEKTLEKGEQSILLLNRRGYNTAVTCRRCSEPLNCPNCSISLTYHETNKRLMCHYCGFSMKITANCPKCGSSDLIFVGSGTQRAEETISSLLPEARVLRMDADSTLAKQSHEIKLNDFRMGKYDILLGTQMVAKGLDFPKVTLVGVLSADQAMYSEDFRSYERAFSLLTQVVGRSGRSKIPGTAIIQTYTPENSLIAQAAAQDYDSFYDSEIKLRRTMLYPPFSDICMIVISSERETRCQQAAFEFSNRLCSSLKNDYPELPIRILGPAAATIHRMNNRYRYKMVIKFKNSPKFREMLSNVLINFAKDRNFQDTSVYADIDPDSII